MSPAEESLHATPLYMPEFASISITCHMKDDKVPILCKRQDDLTKPSKTIPENEEATLDAPISKNVQDVSSLRENFPSKKS